MAYKSLVVLAIFALTFIAVSAHYGRSYVSHYVSQCEQHCCCQQYNYPTCLCPAQSQIPQCQRPIGLPEWTLTYDSCKETCMRNLHCIEYCQMRFNHIPPCDTSSCECHHHPLQPQWNPGAVALPNFWNIHQSVSRSQCCCSYYNYPTCQCFSNPLIPQCQAPMIYPDFTQSYEACTVTCHENLFCLEYCRIRFHKIPTCSTDMCRPNWHPPVHRNCQHSHKHCCEDFHQHPTFQCIGKPDLQQCQKPDGFPLAPHDFEACRASCHENLYCIEFCDIHFQKIHQCTHHHQTSDLHCIQLKPKACQPDCCKYLFQPTYACLATPDRPECLQPKSLPTWTVSYSSCMTQCKSNLVCQQYCETRFHEVQQCDSDCQCPSLLPQPKPDFVNGIWYFPHQYNTCE